MSLLTAFAASAATIAENVIGAESVTIGGTAYPAVIAEETGGREYDVPGFKPTADLRAVIRIAAAPAGDVVGKLATARGKVYRVGSVNSGQGFVTLELHEKSRS